MRTILFLSLFIVIISTIDGQLGTIVQQRVVPAQQFSVNNRVGFLRNILPDAVVTPAVALPSQLSVQMPFPQCTSTGSARELLNPAAVGQLFLATLQREDSKLKHERARNDDLLNHGIMDFDAIQLRTDTHNGALVARTATTVSQILLSQAGCITNSAMTAQIDNFLTQFRLPDDVCPFDPNANCDGLTHYRTITGVCNNLQHPYQGSAQTAYARLLPAAYEDGLRLPRSQSVLGGPLPGCRDISLAMDSKPKFDQSFNNMFTIYGQFIVHDFAMATPVTDSGRTPITSCSCDSPDPDMCTVIGISANDPFMAGQKCMAVPATAQAFANQQCTLGVKDQMNGNSHYIDLSVTYGSTRATGVGLRSGMNGLLKVAKKTWSKFDIPPGQRVGKSCTDSTEVQKCFAGGDSRLMENTVLAGIQTQWVREHNNFAGELARVRPDWRNNDDILYEESKKVLAALHQRYTYKDWLPILIGHQAAQRYVGENELFTRYDPAMPGVMFNEAATAALRLHTLVRDLYSRCNPQGQLMDQVWFLDISQKSKLAYDVQHNGVDSLLCGSLYDFGFAGDTNFAHQIHNRLFETVNSQGEIRRSDIVSINIARAREHGIAGYNAYRQLCGMRPAAQFQDFADTMSMESIQKLQMIYKHPDDVDLFIGINHEIPLPDGLVGPTSACIIGTQFRHLKYGDRFFYTHEGQFTPEQLNSIKQYSYNCFVCHTTDIEKVPINPFRPPNDLTNPLRSCSECPIFDFTPWSAGPVAVVGARRIFI